MDVCLFVHRYIRKQILPPPTEGSGGLSEPPAPYSTLLCEACPLHVRNSKLLLYVASLSRGVRPLSCVSIFAGCGQSVLIGLD